MLRYLSILVAIYLCAACTPALAHSPTLTALPEPATITPKPTALPVTPSPQPTQAPESNTSAYDYKVIYQDGSFIIREAFLGTDAIWKTDFKMPQARIENTTESLGLGREMACNKPPGSNLRCTQTVEVPLEKGGADVYILALDSVNGGKGSLVKNGRLIWSGYTNGGESPAILSSIRVGDEIAFDYSKSNLGSNDKLLWITASILISRGNTVALMPDAFAPHAIQGKLIYFKIKNRKEILVFNGKDLGETYDEIFNQLCCWHGAPIEIAANGDLIDFFAQKGPDWYHVQAGYLPGTK